MHLVKVFGDWTSLLNLYICILHHLFHYCLHIHNIHLDKVLEERASFPDLIILTLSCLVYYLLSFQKITQVNDLQPLMYNLFTLYDTFNLVDCYIYVSYVEYLLIT